MKKILALALFALAAPQLQAQTTWKADPMHSKVGFGITHLGISEVTGVFKTFNATATANKADFSDAVFELTVDVASINTEVEMRDGHLKSPDFFEVEKFPNMVFKSTGIKKSGKDRYQLTGNLTLHGVTKPVTMNLWYRGTTLNPQSKATTAGFQLTGVIKRTDFGIGPKYPAPGLSNEVNIKADGEFVKG
jgi:polyisoprenoid-binding protein YceI